MPSPSHFSANDAARDSALASLFPSCVAVKESRIPGSVADLLHAEVHYVERAWPKRVQEFAAGRACARAALAQFGIAGFALHVAADRQPVWPKEFVGSITHTEGYCAAVVAPRAAMLAVGVDAEVVGAPTPDIWTTICGPEEWTWLNALPAERQAAAVTVLFTAKEAFYKCQYPVVGEWLDFHDLHVSVATWAAGRGSFSVRPKRAIRFGSHASLPVAGQFAIDGCVMLAGVAVAAHVAADQ